MRSDRNIQELGDLPKLMPEVIRRPHSELPLDPFHREMKMPARKPGEGRNGPIEGFRRG